MGQAEDDFVFAPEVQGERADGAASSAAGHLTILTVDDDLQFQQALHQALTGFRYQDHPVRLQSAQSATEAARILAAQPDVAVVILDVVMETDDAGLRLVRSVRELLGNSEVRIVLLTGQPGMSSLKKSLDTLDINDYWLKTELTHERLHGILTGNLRAWEQIHALNRARQGLQTIVEASNSLNRARNLEEFSEHVIRELSRLLGLDPEGVVCVQASGTDAGDPHKAWVVGAAGRFASAISHRLQSFADAPIRDLLLQSLSQQATVETETSQVLFFPATANSPQAAVYLATRQRLDETERELLGVFCTNIQSGLINVSLTSQLNRMALEDSQLSLPNANALMRCVDTILDMQGPRDRMLLLVDLNQYSQGCLSLGIEQGDLMLQRMARHLCSVFPPPCMVARLHDDTFGIVGPAAMVDEARIESLESADPDDDQLPPFIGMYAARMDLDSYRGGARGAMAAGMLLLRRARAQGLRQLVDYWPGMERETDRHFTLSRQLYQGLQDEQLSIELQPQIDLATGAIVGAEALARWTQPDGTRVPPAQFVPVAEASGQVVHLGRLVIGLACRALVALAQAGFAQVSVAVNVSALQLARRSFVSEITGLLALHGIAPQRLELEITESAMMGDHQANIAVLQQLRGLGFRIAVDDFGTGHSSLAYLQDLPLTMLKVDRSFIQEIGEQEAPARRAPIAAMVIGLGAHLGLKVLAEGVENAAQAEWLRERGCGLAQGYYFARPEPLPAFIERLRAA
ncbi:EAL domain-containing protein [Xylophilus sp. GW821-FHT01B05]